MALGWSENGWQDADPGIRVYAATPDGGGHASRCGMETQRLESQNQPSGHSPLKQREIV